MASNFVETIKATGHGLKPKHLRQDWISHGIEQAVLHAGGPLKYFNSLRKEFPQVFANLVAKYIPVQVEQTINMTGQQVLVINLPTSRQALTIDDAKIIDCEPSSQALAECTLYKEEHETSTDCIKDNESRSDAKIDSVCE